MTYSMLVVIAFCFQILFLGYLLVHFKGRISPYYYFMFIAVLLTTYGDMMINSAKDLESALLANQTSYLGAVFSPLFLMFCIADLCKVNLKKVIGVSSCGISCLLFVMVATNRKHDWYYKKANIEFANGMTFLKKEDGPLHFLFPTFLALMILFGFFIIVQTLRNRRDVSYKNSVMLLFSLIVTSGSYIVEKVNHYNLEILPFIYCFLELVMIIVLHRISLYDIPYMSAKMSLVDKSNGYILFDGRGNYLTCDEVARYWFGELGELRADRPIKKAYTPILTDLQKWCNGTAENEKAQYEVGDQIVVAYHSILKEHWQNAVHCIRLEDETEQIKYQNLVESYNKNLTEEVKRRTQSMKSMHEDILVSMANIVESRDQNTGGHVKRTSDVVKLFTDALIENEDFTQMTPYIGRCIAKAAPLHDFGKIAVPDNILNKPGKFEPEEYEVMKTHSAKGAVIVEQILHSTEDNRFKKIAENVAHYHHEKWDGTGYPDNLKGEDIPFEARVMALADVFDALVSKRVYKDSFSYDKAFSIIEESAGSHFDPVLAEEFLKCKNELIALYDSYEE